MLSWIRRKLLAWSPEHKRVVVEFPNNLELKRRSLSGESGGTIVGFFTRDGVYEAEKNRLSKSAELLGLPVDIAEMKSAGSWVRNAGMKPAVLVEMRKKHRGPLLYVDVDAVFHRNPWPGLAHLDCDMAAYYEPAGNLLSGTLFINDTPAAAEMLDEWVRASADAPDEWDQRVLGRIVAEDAARCSRRYRFQTLPVSYCWVFDKIDNPPCGEIFVEHLQASREAKKRKRMFGRVGKGVKRRRHRVQAVERVLFAETHDR